MTNLVERAKAFAIEAHGDQLYGDLPYEFHLKSVVTFVGKDAPEEVQAAGWLHDVVEDTDVTLFEIREQFGGRVARIVDCCTDGAGRNRKERKQAAYKKLRVAPADARRVKLADRLANMVASIENPSMAEMYRKEFQEFIRACGTDEENNDLLVKLFWVYLDSTLAYENKK